MQASFGIWQWSAKTLSIHSFHTAEREAFYWMVGDITVNYEALERAANGPTSTPPNAAHPPTTR